MQTENIGDEKKKVKSKYPSHHLSFVGKSLDAQTSMEPVCEHKNVETQVPLGIVNDTEEKQKEANLKCETGELYETVREISANVLNIRRQLTHIAENCEKDQENNNNIGIEGITDIRHADEENRTSVQFQAEQEHLIDTLMSFNISTIGKNPCIFEEVESKVKTRETNEKEKVLTVTPKFVFSPDGITTELHKSIAEGNIENITNLIQENQNCINFRDESGRTPLHVSLSNTDNISVIPILLSHGADPNITDSNLKTGLHYAAESGSCDIVEIILKRIKDMNSKDKEGRTALHYLALKNDVKVAAKLLAEDQKKEHSNFVNITNNVGQAALHIAAYLANTEFVTLIKTFKADLDIQDCEGLTALHNTILTSAPGNYECFKVLISAGASTNLGDKRGLTPLHLAVITKNQTMTDHLLPHLADLALGDEQGKIITLREYNKKIHYFRYDCFPPCM